MIVRTIVKTGATIFLAISIMAIVTHASLIETRKKNGFNRNFTNSNIAMVSVSQKISGLKGISGASHNKMYFTTRDPRKLLVTDKYFSNYKYITLNVPGDPRTASFFETKVDSPDVYIFAGNVPAIVTGDLTLDQHKTHRFPTSIFTRCVPISPNRFAFRGFDHSTGGSEQIFLTGDLTTGTITRKHKVYEQMQDGGIAADGLLHYDSSAKRIVYVFFYSSNFLCFDTNLNLQYNAHTIDTLNGFQVKAGKAKYKGSLINTTLSPLKNISRTSAVDAGFLFTNSGLKADNETDSGFSNNSVIDIYRLKDSKYQGSFYIPAYKGEKIQYFKVQGKAIIALYKSHIVLYHIQ